MRQGLMFIALTLVLPAHAADTLRNAVEQAWARQPAAQAQPARAEEFVAKNDAAGAAFPEPPSLRLGNRNDRIDRNNGQLEWEAEIALPLWLPGEQARQASIANAEKNQYDTVLAAAKLKVAGEVREAYWQARLAENELALVRRKAEEAAVLAADIERRTRAGDLARVDLNQARSAERLARAALAESEVKNFRAKQAFVVLTGMTTLPEAAESTIRAGSALDDHPLLAPLQRAVETSHARLSQASQSLRSNPEIEFGVRRERSAFNDPYASSLQVRFRLPFATDARNRPRIAAANAELIETQAAYGVERTRVAAEIEAARREMEQAQAIENMNETRFSLAADTQRLLAKAFALGELDLFTRLRAENERFESELNFSRARLETARAMSRLNQALGVLP